MSIAAPDAARTPQPAGTSETAGTPQPVGTKAPTELFIDGLPQPRRTWAAIAIWLAMSMSVLDSAVANVALPTIARQLGASPGVSIWVINAYQLAITVLLLPLAALGDRIGFRRVYLPGMLLFVAGSLGCAVSGSLGALIAARVIQGMGAAALMAINGALVRAIYPQAILGRGIGWNAMVISVAAAIGPTLASMILAVSSWPWLFAINLPVGLAAFFLGRRVLPHTPGHDRAPDYPSAVLSAIALGAVVFGIETLARDGARDGLPLLALGVVAGVLLVRRERGREAPLVPLDLLRIRIFALSILTSITSFAAQMLAFVSLPFLIQSRLGLGEVATGLLMTPWPLAAGLAAMLAGRLADRYPAGLLGGIGLACLACGLGALSFLGAGSTPADVVWRMALCGAGFGLFQSPNNRTMLSAAPRQRSGAAGGMLATARLLGQTAGAVAVAAGFHLAGVGTAPLLLRLGAAAAVLAALISLSRLGASAQRASSATTVS